MDPRWHSHPLALYILLLFSHHLLKCASAQPCPAFPLCECETVGPDYIMTCKNTDLTDIPPLVGTATKIDIQGNNIGEVKNRSFVAAPSATSIRLYNNYISSIASGAFTTANTGLISLSFERNELQFLPVSVFKNLPNLERLQLQSNKISLLSSGVFQGLGKLLEVDLSQNRLEILDEDLFQHLVSLQTLRLDDNAIRSLPESVLSPLLALSELHMTGNRIEAVPNVAGSHDLTHLFLSDNPRLSEVNVTLFQGLTKLRTFDITGAWLHCDCFAIPFREWTIDTTVPFDNLATAGTCITPKNLSHIDFLTLKLDDLVCPTTTPPPTTSTMTIPATTKLPATSEKTTHSGIISGPSESGNGLGISDTTLGIIIGCSIGGVLLVIVILIAVCSARAARNRSRHRDVRYILKTGITPSVGGGGGESGGSLDSYDAGDHGDHLPQVGDIFTVTGPTITEQEKPPPATMADGYVAYGSGRFTRGPPEAEAYNGNSRVGLGGKGRAAMERRGGSQPQHMHSASMDLHPPRYEESEFDESTIPRTPNKMNGLLQYAYTRENERRGDSRSKSFNYGGSKSPRYHRTQHSDLLNFYNLSPAPKRHPSHQPQHLFSRTGSEGAGRRHENRFHQLSEGHMTDQHATPAFAYVSTSETSSASSHSPYDRRVAPASHFRMPPYDKYSRKQYDAAPTGTVSSLPGTNKKGRYETNPDQTSVLEPPANPQHVVQPMATRMMMSSSLPRNGSKPQSTSQVTNPKDLDMQYRPRGSVSALTVPQCESADSGVASPHGSIVSQQPLEAKVSLGGGSGPVPMPMSPCNGSLTSGMSSLTPAAVGTPPKKPKSETYV